MYNENSNKASQKYARENLEQIAIRVPKGERQALKDEADKHGISLAGFIIKACNLLAGHEVLSTPYKRGTDE